MRSVRFAPHISVYGIGLPRTGTNSLASALHTLGISGENHCVLHNHKKQWNPCQQKQHFTSDERNYKFFVQNDAYENIEEFVDEKLSECTKTHGLHQ